MPVACRMKNSSYYIAPIGVRTHDRGLSAREMWTQRDQFSNSQIPLVDRDLTMTQHKTRVLKHPYSELPKAHLSKRGTDTALTVGDLVYLHTDRNKSCARHRYLVASKSLVSVPFPWPFFGRI